MNSLDMEVPADTITGLDTYPHPPPPMYSAQTLYWRFCGGGGGGPHDPSNHPNLPVAIRAFIGLALQPFMLPI